MHILAVAHSNAFELANFAYVWNSMRNLSATLSAHYRQMPKTMFVNAAPSQESRRNVGRFHPTTTLTMTLVGRTDERRRIVHKFATEKCHHRSRRERVVANAHKLNNLHCPNRCRSPLSQSQSSKIKISMLDFSALCVARCAVTSIGSRAMHTECVLVNGMQVLSAK